MKKIFLFAVCLLVLMTHVTHAQTPAAPFTTASGLEIRVLGKVVEAPDRPAERGGRSDSAEVAAVDGVAQGKDFDPVATDPYGCSVKY